MAAQSGPRLIRSVGAIIFDHSGRLLLIQRGHAPAKGQWSVPGGKVEPGESDAQAVEREVMEETGLRVQCGDLAGSVERAGAPGVVYEIFDYDAVLTGDAGAGGDGALPGLGEAGPGGDGALPGLGEAGFGEAGPGRAADDAADLRWVHPDDLHMLDLTPGLVELLREWGRLS